MGIVGMVFGFLCALLLLQLGGHVLLLVAKPFVSDAQLEGYALGIFLLMPPVLIVGAFVGWKFGWSHLTLTKRSIAKETTENASPPAEKR